VLQAINKRNIHSLVYIYSTKFKRLYKKHYIVKFLFLPLVVEGKGITSVASQ